MTATEVTAYQPKAKEASTLVLCYRRSGATDEARYITRGLARRLLEFNVFSDMVLPPETRQPERLCSQLKGAKLMLLVIDPEWDLRSKEDRDWVAQPLEIALREQVAILPIFIRGARVPDTLSKAVRNVLVTVDTAYPAHPADADHMLDRLADRIREIILSVKLSEFNPPQESLNGLWWGMAVVGVILFILISLTR